MDNVRSIIDNLSSDKIKEREAALVTLREVFSRDSVVRRFNADKEGNAKPMVWLTLFQALFTSVAKEKIAMQKKSTAKSGSTSATALRRLTDTARAVRWLIERTVHLLNKKVITALVAHLSQMLSTDRTPNAQLFQPVALDYAKALKCLLSFRPHLEHLEDSLWVKLVEVSFNVVLEDPINTHFGPAGSDDDGADADSDMYVDDEGLAVDSDEDPPPRGTKRKSTERSASPRKKAKPNRIISVTLEQVEFASLLPILIGSTVAPILSKGERMEHIPQAILSRLQRFLELYPADSSLLHDYLTTLKHTLSHLSLNKKHDVECFARFSWDALVGLWGTKDKRMKEDLVIVLRQLFEFVVCPELGEADEHRPKLPRFDAVESIGRLWQVLNGEAESKWGMEALNMESLRLENKVLHERKHRPPFTANTFRSGLNFDSNQALSWCILELQSDCTAQLFKLSESMQDVLSPARPNRKDSRRSKLDSPVNSLLDTIRQGSISQTLCHRLQSLLFFIDRHWSLLHASLKQSIIDLLLQFVTHSTAEVQSWVFLNLAAVAYAEGTRVKPLTGKADRQDVLDTGVWESVWTHSVRRANAAATCRAACHTGQTILTCIYSRTPRTSGNILSTAKILGEIETLMKDMDVQGPSYPYDSVCIFLSECLQIASQDARLYRMRLEDKVLTWLIDSWKVSAGRAKMMPYLIGDVLLLLETICGLSKRARLLAWQAVPDCPLVHSVIEENKVELIRDFVLYAKLPPFSQPQELAAKSSIRPSASDDKVADIDLIDLIPPRPKERKISSFFSRTLDSLVADAETIQAHARAETYRQHLDIAVTAALFEALLVSNGVNCNRTVLQNAAKVITSCMNFLTSRQWSHSETLLVAQGLEPLIHDEDGVEDDFFTEAMPLPGHGSGIRQQTLRYLLANTTAESDAHSAERLVLLQTLWQHAEMQDAFTFVHASAKSLLTRLLGAKSGDGHGPTADGDDKDGFGPIRTSLQESTASVREGESGMCMQHLLKICIGLSACGPYLRSPSSKPSSGEELFSLIMSTAQDHPTTFRLAFPIFLHEVRRDIVVLSSNEIGKLFDDFGDLLQQYAFSRSEEFQRLLVGLLTTCLRPCTWDKFGETAAAGQFREFCDWMFKVLGKDKVRSWNLRDGIGQFLLAYITAFPSKGPGTASPHAQDENMDHDGSSDNAEDAGNPQLGQPTTLLLDLNMDVDMRVRFRASVMNAHLYSFIIEENFPAIELYGYMKDTYTNDPEIYEHMMTRMLSLGNIMITSSAVRRGPYWHLLEAHPHSPMYSTHIESILTGVAERLGFSSLSVIFEAYASQIQYSMNKAKSDFSKYPSHLLGYRDITEATRAAFRPCAPLTVWECPEAYFETHCRILGMTVLQGLERSFGDVLGYGLLQHIDSHSADDIWSIVRQKMQAVDNFEATFNENVDSTIVMILRCLGDLDFRKGGSVATVLNDVSPDSLSAFKQLNVHRTSEATTLHTPNVPFYPAETIIQCLQWVSSRSSSGFSSATTFHVAQELFNRVHETPIVNEQWRLVTAITMWLAYRVEDLEDTSVMRAVLNGATLMLSQSDLARSAQSILDYFFKRYRLSKPKEPHSLTPTLPGILLRICRTAQDYTSRKNDPLVQTGASLLAWVDKQLQLFAECSPFQSIVRKALAAWPLAITESHPLADIYNAITMHNLTSVLEDRHITSNKFHLVQRIHQNAMEYDGAEDDYAKTYFWRLKECMPSSIHLQQEDITAFTSLLYLNRGHIATYNPERPDLNLPRLRHRRLFKVTHQDAKGKCWSNSQDAIMTGLLVMLEDSNPLFVSNAYHSLRRIFASFADDATSRSTTALPAEYQADVALLTEYRRPPLPRPPLVDVKAALKGDEYRRSIDNFSNWISVIGVLFCDTLAQIDNFYGQLNLILVSHVAFAEEIMPILVQTLLQLEQFEKEKRFGSLPYSLHDTLSEYFEYVLRSEAADPSCIRAIVDMVLHLRYFAPRSSDQLAYNKWLRIDYVLLARSAILCGAYTTALLFVEIALEDSDTSAASVEQVLFEIYAHIDEPDGFYAISTDDLQQFLVKRYHHENQWEKAFRFHGASLEAAYSSKSDRDGLTKSFHHFGFDHLAMDILRNVDQNPSETNPSLSTNYRLGWRTETWDLPSQSMDSPGVPLYSSLRAIYRERDSSSVRDVVQTALSSEMDYLRSLGSENLAEIRVVSQELMSLREVLRWTDKAFQDSIASYHTQPTSCEDLLCIDSQFSFADIESIMATRLSLIRSLRRKEERQQLGRFIPTAVRNLKSIEKSCLLNLSRAARAAGQTQIALNSVIRAQQLDDRPSSEVSEEFANVLWLQKEEPLAVRYLKSLVENDDAGKDVPVDQSRKAIWLSRLGTWSAEAYIEKPSEISTRYFDRAISLVEEIKRDNAYDPSLSAIYRECAMFAEHQYHSVSRSPDALRWKVYVDRKRQEIELREKDIGSQTDKNRRDRLKHEQSKARKLLTEDSELFGKHNVLRDTLLKQALEMHSRCLEASDSFDDDSVTRFCSLWFATFDDESISDTVKAGLARIPSRKLIMLAHQLTARVSTSQSSTLHSSQESLQNTIIRMCQDHPFHILYQVYCLSDHNSSTSNGRRQSGRQSQASTQTERGSAASSIMDRLRIDDVTGQRVRDIERLCDAYLEWAKFPISKNPQYNGKTPKQKDRTPFPIPKALKILSVKNLRVPVTTFHTPLDPTLEYADCIWIRGYKTSFETAGGINLPKISICMGADGQNYKQLFKGEGGDDMRQDAVMEQVFELVNGLLKQDRETRRRELHVRDYKVIPLASQAGILEFVGNTAPLKSWLTQRHAAYRPGDWTPSQAQGYITQVQKTSPFDHDKQVEAFVKVRENFKPVMRHYFTEKHKTPIAWFQMRLRYTRSVATTSIVGHILGLGDRHTSNILLDNASGEVVHIDLGIAFDQGKLLGVPEKVPFRMTADVVDGMGPSGTSGVFQRCAEETLRVLRNESEVILTVLEVFKHDPLHSWTASEVRVKHAQGDASVPAPPLVPSPTATTGTGGFSDILNGAQGTNAFPFLKGIGIDMTSGSADEAADRALSSVTRKLDKSLSVESTVLELLAEATDITNLATIFFGWGAHL